MKTTPERPWPRIGDIVEFKASHGKETLKGVVLGVRVHKEDNWTGADVFVKGQPRWVTRNQILGVIGRPKGISRIDQPTRRTHGWFVRVDYQGKNPRLARLFSDQKYNGIGDELRAALDFYEEEKKVSAVPAGIKE